MASKQSSGPPYYIVGLPTEPLEAAEAKAKFERLSAELSKAFPFVEEVRAVVKTKGPSEGHARYEVSVDVYTPKEVHAFTESGRNLATVFEAMGPKMKRLLASKKSRVTGSRGESRRKGDTRV
jgi:ribosome-associated translation inhibitor RaiA